jgi:hypothetical protein
LSAAVAIRIASKPPTITDENSAGTILIFQSPKYSSRSRHQHDSPVNFLTECIFWTTLTSTAHASPSRYDWRMDNATGSAFLSVGLLADIFRLVPRNERAAFGEMLADVLRGRVLSDHEVRRIAERAWHQFLKHERRE